MIEHVVVFKWREGTSAETMSRIEGALAALKGALPEIVDLSVGRNFSDRAQGYQTGLVVRFRDKEGLAAYQQAPAHREVVESLIKPNAESVLAVDYEF